MITEQKNEVTSKGIEIDVLINAKLVTGKIASELQGAISDTKRYIRIAETLPINPELKKEIACQILNAFYEDLRAITDLI